jgi:hypothetical protein
MLGTGMVMLGTRGKLISRERREKKGKEGYPYQACCWVRESCGPSLKFDTDHTGVLFDGSRMKTRSSDVHLVVAAMGSVKCT